MAYREMELYSDAVDEFRMCLASEELKLQSLHMMGICALSIESFQDAVSHLEQALALVGEGVDSACGIQFDLARTYEAMGEPTRAREQYTAVIEADPKFPGVQERLDALASAEPAEGLESFADLVAEADDDESEASAETFESFDDLITEVESIAEVSEHVDDQGAVEADVDTDSKEPDSEDPDSQPSSGRKKKISFV
jgi:tetratricopeptide (TPR) repeat protein